MKNTFFYIILFLISFGLLSCENDIKDIEAIERQVDNTDWFKDIELSYSDSARIRVLISAPIMESKYEHNRISEDNFPEGLEVDFFDEKGVANSWLSAKRAKRFPQKNLIVVRDSVVLYNIEGDTLRTDELFWDNKDGQIYTERVFRYSKADGERIFGRKFRSDQSFTEYSLEKMSGKIKQVVE